MLPGDGDAHVAKPPGRRPPPAADDPWVGAQDLIAMPAVRRRLGRSTLPAIDEFKLANGLTVYVVKNDRLPVVSLQLAIRAGRMHEPRARLGVAEATADMLVKGTRQHDAAGLARAIDSVGGTIAADATFEATLVSCSVLARNVRRASTCCPRSSRSRRFPQDELAEGQGQR